MLCFHLQNNHNYKELFNDLEPAGYHREGLNNNNIIIGHLSAFTNTNWHIVVVILSISVIRLLLESEKTYKNVDVIGVLEELVMSNLKSKSFS